MDDALVVGVLHRLTDRYEQFQPFLGRQSSLVAESVQRQTVDQFHDEERLAGRRKPAVEDASNVRVVHHGQGLPLLLEARQHGLAVHASLDQLQRHLALDRLGLLGDPDFAHAALADLLDEAVAAGDDHAGLDLRVIGGDRRGGRVGRVRPVRSGRSGPGAESTVCPSPCGGRSSRLPDASCAASNASTAARSSA